MNQSEQNLLPKSNVAGFYAEGEGNKVYWDQLRLRHPITTQKSLQLGKNLTGIDAGETVKTKPKIWLEIEYAAEKKRESAGQKTAEFKNIQRKLTIDVRWILPSWAPKQNRIK